MFRHRPALAAELLTDVLGIDVPEHREARVETGEFADPAPTEYRADAVVVLTGEDGPALAGVPGDAAGPAALPDGAAGRLRRIRHRDVVPLRSSSGIRVSGWFPWCWGPSGYRSSPTRWSPGAPPSRRCIVFAALPEAARHHLEALMASPTYEYASEFVRRHVFQGRAQGRARGEATAVLAVLDARGIAVPDDLRARIAECTDLEQLDTWVRRAATAVDRGPARLISARSAASRSGTGAASAGRRPARRGWAVGARAGRSPRPRRAGTPR